MTDAQMKAIAQRLADIRAEIRMLDAETAAECYRDEIDDLVAFLRKAIGVVH